MTEQSCSNRAAKLYRNMVGLRKKLAYFSMVYWGCNGTVTACLLLIFTDLEWDETID
jgi:hypothetical protein